jgi:hypothetical protein
MHSEHVDGFETVAARGREQSVNLFGSKRMDLLTVCARDL